MILTQKQIDLLNGTLETLYNIKTNLSNKQLADGTNRKRIEIPEKSSSTFREVIQPYLVNCMKYKVSNGNKGTL